MGTTASQAPTAGDGLQRRNGNPIGTEEGR